MFQLPLREYDPTRKDYRVTSRCNWTLER